MLNFPRWLIRTCGILDLFQCVLLMCFLDVTGLSFVGCFLVITPCPLLLFAQDGEDGEKKRSLLEMVHRHPSGYSSGGRSGARRGVNGAWSSMGSLVVLLYILIFTCEWDAVRLILPGAHVVSNRCLFEKQCHVSLWETRGAFGKSQNHCFVMAWSEFQTT